MASLTRCLSDAERAAQATKRLAGQMSRLAADIETLEASDYITHRHKLSDYVLTYSQYLADANRKLLQLAARFEMLKSQSSAVEESAADLADFAADRLMISDHAATMERLGYALLARQIARLNPYLFPMAITEVTLYPDGWAQIKVLKEAVQRATDNSADCESDFAADWARMTTHLEHAVLETGVKEVSARKGGWLTLAALRTAIDRLVNG